MRKIIHIDMDCFYAAIEIRDNPQLKDKPVAVGGSPESRGVLCTCNYLARKYGIHSAMPTSQAYKLCKDLIVLPVNIAKYKAVSERIQAIFHHYANLVEPLSFDEAFLDVTNANHHQGSATLIAQAIREQIWREEQLTASAGVASNKLLAKIASGWNKPNGLFVIKPAEVAAFIPGLAVNELFGVGKVTEKRLHGMGLQNCADLQKLSLATLVEQFGKLGEQLYNQCRGIDHRPVEAERERKSFSVEHTFPQDITQRELALAALTVLYEKLISRMQEAHIVTPIKNQFIKIKYSNFRQITTECSADKINYDIFKNQFLAAYAKLQIPIRLLGIGVHFKKAQQQNVQQSLFD